VDMNKPDMKVLIFFFYVFTIFSIFPLLRKEEF